MLASRSSYVYISTLRSKSNTETRKQGREDLVIPSSSHSVRRVEKKSA
jgi:hypothetical protein